MLGLTFNRAAVAELRERINLRWGANCIRPAHRVITFDHLHVDILNHLLSEGKLTWPKGIATLDVRDDYRGLTGFHFLKDGGYKRFASLDDNRKITSHSQKVTKPCWGIGRIEYHENILNNGIVSHEDVRSILQAAMELEDLQQFAANWLSESYRALVIDEVYDANTRWLDRKSVV